MEEHGEVPVSEAEDGGGGGVEDLVHELQLGEVVPRPEGTELRRPALPRAARDRLRVCAGKRAPGLGGLEVLGFAVAVTDRPRRAVAEDLVEIPVRKGRDRPLTAEPGGHAALHGLDERAEAAAESRPPECRCA